MLMLIVEVLDDRDTTPRDHIEVYLTFPRIIGVNQHKARTDRHGKARFELSHNSPGDEGQISVNGDDVYDGVLRNETKTFFIR
jgi:hypothetical protein